MGRFPRCDGEYQLLKDSLNRLYIKAILLQIGVAIPLVLIAWLLVDKTAALSAAVGGLSVVCGSVVYAALARESTLTARPAGSVLRRHLLAEVSKVLVVLGVLFGAFASGWFVPVWLVGAMVVALIGHWLLVFLIR